MGVLVVKGFGVVGSIVVNFIGWDRVCYSG